MLFEGTGGKGVSIMIAKVIKACHMALLCLNVQSTLERA